MDDDYSDIVAKYKISLLKDAIQKYTYVVEIKDFCKCGQCPGLWRCNVCGAYSTDSYTQIVHKQDCNVKILLDL